MAEAEILKKRKSIPVKRFESDDFLIKSSKSKSKRPYVHKDSFQTKAQLREEIRLLKSKVAILSRQVNYYESICLETPPWKMTDQTSFKLLKPCLKRNRSDLDEDSNNKKHRLSNVVDLKEDSEIVAIGGTGLKSINSDVDLTSKGNARKESMHKKSNDNIEETGVAHQRQLVIVDKNKTALAKKKGRQTTNSLPKPNAKVNVIATTTETYDNIIATASPNNSQLTFDSVESSPIIEITDSKGKKFQCTECELSFEKEKLYDNHCQDLHSPIELFSSDVEKPDEPNSLGNTPSIENITHTAIEKEVVKPEVRSSDKLSSEFDIEFIQELPNNKHVVMECQECGIIFENEFEQKIISSQNI